MVVFHIKKNDQESHNQRLKALSDKDNTNLYVSNLPRTLVEAVSSCRSSNLISLSDLEPTLRDSKLSLETSSRKRRIQITNPHLPKY